MPFPGVSFGNAPEYRLVAGKPLAETALGDHAHSARDGAGGVLHDERTAVLEHEVELAEPGHADPCTLGDVRVAPLVHLRARPAVHVAAEPGADPVAGAHA